MARRFPARGELIDIQAADPWFTPDEAAMYSSEVMAHASRGVLLLQQRGE